MTRDLIIASAISSKPEAIDGQTGLHRLPCLQCVFEKEMSRVSRSGEPVTLGFIDIDSYSRHREKAGAERATDTVRQLCGIVEKSLRGADTACLCRDDLLAMVLPGTRADTAHVVGERIRRAIEVESAGAVTVSVGLASFPEDGMDTTAIVSRAADALIQAKREGRNRVYSFERKRNLAGNGPGRVLAVDDDPKSLKILAAQLAAMGHKVLTAEGAEEAFRIAQQEKIDLLLLDIRMPGVDGFEACRRFKSLEATRFVPVILLTALDDVGSRVKGIKAGADDFITKPANKEELAARTASLVKIKRLHESLVSVERALISLANAVEAKDSYTEGHTRRVSSLAMLVAARMGLGETETRALRLGGILHDVGKIGVPEGVLNKNGPLDAEEWRIMRTHPDQGYKICLPLIDSIGHALDVIRHHHEKLDGSSYPDGLGGKEISMLARIMAVVDCFDAMVTDRPYRKAFNKQQALAMLKEEVGKGWWDGQVVRALEEAVSHRG